MLDQIYADYASTFEGAFAELVGVNYFAVAGDPATIQGADAIPLGELDTQGWLPLAISGNAILFLCSDGYAVASAPRRRVPDIASALGYDRAQIALGDLSWAF